MRLTFLAYMLMAGAAVAGSGAPVVVPVALPQLPLGMVTLPSGKAINLSVAAGAGAYRGPTDPPRRMWTITDRGPSHECAGEPGPSDKICQAGKKGRVFLLPGYSPSIYALEIGESSAKFIEMVTVRGASGRPLTGLGNGGTTSRPEVYFAPDGRPLDPDPSGVEPSGLVRLGDGTFFIADASAPSILEVDAGGTIRRRLVPDGLFEAYKSADYPVEAVLPAELSNKDAGRGFGAIALSPDEAHLFVALQSPVRKDAAAPEMLTILKVDRTSGATVEQFSYPVVGERPESEGMPQAAPRIVEMQSIAADQLLVLERHLHAARIYRLSTSKGGAVQKSLVFSTEQLPAPLGRVTGMAVLGATEIALMTSDPASEATRTQLFRLTLPSPITK